VPLHQLSSRLRALIRRRRVESELDDEIRFHLEEEAEEQRAIGLSDADAGRAARRDFGNVTLIRETVREAFGWGAADRLIRDVRDGYRTLKSAPIVSIVAILSLGLGIGANTAIFSVLDGLLLKSLPVVEPDRLILLGDASGQRRHWTSPIWREIDRRRELFDGAFAVSSTRFNLAVRGESEYVDGVWATGRMFEVLGVRARLGRTFTERDDQPGGGPDGAVAVISDRFWQQRFGRSPDVIGRHLTVDRVPFTIVGVTPPEFFGVEVGRTFDVAIPVGTVTLMRGANALERRSSWWLRIMMRLQPAQSLDTATAALRALQPQIRAATLPEDWHADTLPNFLRDPLRAEAAATGDSAMRRLYERPLLTIMVVASLVLVIACANLANLLLARASARRHELSLRIALGASRLRIARQLLTESLLLSMAGAALGLLLAHWASDLLVRQMSTAMFNVFLDLPLDLRVLGFTTVVAVATTVLFGTAPAIWGTRVQPQDALKGQGRGIVGEKQLSLGHAFVVLQVTLSLVLVVAAGLFARTFSSLATIDLGFDGRQVLVASVELPGSQIAPAQRREIFRRMIDDTSAIPGVASVALSHVTPVSNNTWNNRVELPDGLQLPAADRLVYFNRLTPGWFQTYGTPILAGRDFSNADTVGAPPVAIVNEAFARRFTGGRNPIGTRVRHPEGVDRRIVGLVKDAVYESQRTAVPPTLYISFWQDADPPSGTSISVRAAGESPALLTRPLVAGLSRVHGDLRVTVTPLARQLADKLTQERMIAVLSTLFAGLALLLAALGLYGITAYTVTRQRTEIGIRVALGATRSGVLRLVLRRALLLVTTGIVLGTAVCLWAARFASPLLFGLEARDPLTLTVACCLLAAVGLAAGWIPARRASRLDPARVLRDG
jgi:putative ABC transport system permease protein